jgi:nitrogen fixation NifU-like protein
MTARPQIGEDGDDLKSLYQEIILDHGKNPRNARIVEHHTCSVKGNNPLCGDRINVTARVGADQTIEDVAAEGKGCAISIASASLMTDALKGQSTAAATQLFEAVKKICTGETDVNAAKAAVPSVLHEHMDKLASLSGVKQFPVRVKCATLPWHALMSCLEGRQNATTEGTSEGNRV